jgi:hypothetical protein
MANPKMLRTQQIAIHTWNRVYAPLGLVVVGVHAPEFEFVKDVDNIDRGIRDHGLTYPIAIDNDFAIWRAFGNDAWPAKYLFDDRGRLVKQWIGEGNYHEIERETPLCWLPHTRGANCRR